MPLLFRVGGLGVTLGGPPVAGHISELSSCGCARALVASEGAHWSGGGFGWATRGRQRNLGGGRERWRRAVDALETGEGLDLSWAKWWRSGAGSRWAVGDVLVVGARVLPAVWCVNVNTVTQVTRNRRRVAVQWATTRRHVLRGRETLSVERQSNGDVLFEVFSYSRPDHAVAWLTYPILSALQHRFTVDVSRRFHQIASEV